MVDSNAASTSTEDDVRAVAEPYGLGAREIAALTVFVERIQAADDPDSRVMQKWRSNAVLRLAESLDALELEQVRQARNAVDIGSGAGFPGLALAAALLDTRVTLIEANRRRSRFLEECVNAMALTNVDVVQTQVELWPGGESAIDLVTSRGVMNFPVMFRLAAPLLEDGGALVLWAHDAEKDGVEDEVRAAALGLSLAPLAILGEGGHSLHVYTKMESPSAAAAASAGPLQRLSRSRTGDQRGRAVRRDRRKAALNLPKCEARIARVSARIEGLKGMQSRTSAEEHERIELRVQELEARRIALVEQREFQKALLSARPEEEDRTRLLAIYEQEDKFGTNDRSRQSLAQHLPALDDLQSELVARLINDGMAEVEFGRLFETDLWKDVTAEARTFEREAERKLTVERGRPEKPKSKALTHRRYKDAELPIDDPWLRLALSPRLLDVVNAYLGMWSKLTHCNQIYQVALREDADPWEPWHRDGQDKRLVRVVLHLSDVQAGSDQLEYVPGSTGEGPYAALWPWAPGGRRVPPATEFAELVPDSAIRRLSARAGTIVLWNTSGLHRAGFTARGPQVLWKCSYSSPASLVFKERKFRVQLPEPCDLSGAARFAVS